MISAIFWRYLSWNKIFTTLPIWHNFWLIIQKENLETLLWRLLHQHRRVPLWHVTILITHFLYLRFDKWFLIFWSWCSKWSLKYLDRIKQVILELVNVMQCTSNCFFLFRSRILPWSILPNHFFFTYFHMMYFSYSEPARLSFTLT